MDHNHCQFLFLQEHWLSDAQLNDIGIWNTIYLATGVSGFNNKDVLSGRPFSICPILWRRDIGLRAKVATGSSRICVLQVCFGDIILLLINAYLPF